MRWEVLLLLRSKYVCVYFWMTVEVSIWIVCLMFMCVYYWQMRRILCTAPAAIQCLYLFLCASLLHLQSCVQCFPYREWTYGWMDGHDMFVYRQDRRWWLAHLWKEDRKRVMEKKTSACSSNSTKTKAETNIPMDQFFRIPHRTPKKNMHTVYSPQGLWLVEISAANQ